MPWLSALFICLLLLSIWGVVNQFQNALSPQVTSTSTENIYKDTQKSSLPKQSNISVSKKNTSEISKSSISQKTKQMRKPKITSTRNYSQPRSLSYEFPLNSCGDKDPGGANSWYPVYVINTPENLNQIKTNYCRDAILKYRKQAKIQSIQVASFLNRTKAQEFADLMQKEIGSGEVGKPSVYNFDNKSVVSSYKNRYWASQIPSPTQFVKNHYQDLNYGNYQTTWNNLSNNFKRKTNGYAEYVKWWNSVREIRIGKITLIEQNNYEALVSADLTYITSTGTYYNDPKNRIYLTWDSQASTWLFEKKF